MFRRIRHWLDVPAVGARAASELRDEARQVALSLQEITLFLKDGRDETAALVETFRSRLEELELSRATWEAETEAAFMRAESMYKAARNAEQRTKTMAKGFALETDEGDLASGPELEAYVDRLSAGDADGSPVNGLRPVHEVLAQSPKAAAQRAKFGRPVAALIESSAAPAEG